MKRTAAVVLSSSLLWTSAAPAFAADVNARVTAPVRVAPGAPVAQIPSLPSVAAPLQTAIPALNVAAPRAAAQAAAPQARVAAAQLAAPAQPNASAADVQRAQTAVYDTGKAAAASSAVELADWTAAPPASSLAGAAPAWRSAEGPSAPALRRRGVHSAVQAPIKESDVALTETLSSRSASSSAIKDATGDEEAMAYGRRERFTLETNQGVVLTEKGLAWIDADGDVVVHDRAAKETKRFTPPMGKADQLAASEDGTVLFVAAGNTVQRWDLATGEATVVLDEAALGGKVLALSALRSADARGKGVDIRTSAGRVFWTPGELAFVKGGDESVAAEDGGAPSLRQTSDGLYLETRGEGTRVWARSLNGDGAQVLDLGTVPAALLGAARVKDGNTLIALTETGFIEWDLAQKRYRSFAVDGLRAAIQTQGRPALDVSADGRRVLIAAGSQVFFADLNGTARGVDSAELETRKWSDENPMFIKDGILHIGDFTFPVTPKYEAVTETRLQKLWRKITRRPAPRGRMVPPVTRDQWAALNLPSNKKALYQTLKGFTLGQNVLYIGETGGGKTWMASMISKLIGKKLYMVSFTEYTKNQDLLFSRTFGEEAKGKTGKTLETVLQWLDDKDGGILLLDEMHKPLEGIAALNNVLQNLSYHFSGKDIVGSRKTHYVIGTMNPVKPPYKGEPPSGELSSRFGTTVQVNYLPPAEEAALLSIFFPGAPEEISRKLVAIAKELRKIYPDVLPLPISSRTLLYIAEHVARFPGDDPVEIFKTTYNPGTIVEDPSIVEAIDKALRAHDLRSAAPEGKKKALNP